MTAKKVLANSVCMGCIGMMMASSVMTLVEPTLGTPVNVASRLIFTLAGLGCLYSGRVADKEESMNKATQRPKVNPAVMVAQKMMR